MCIELWLGDTYSQAYYARSNSRAHRLCNARYTLTSRNPFSCGLVRRHAKHQFKPFENHTMLHFAHTLPTAATSVQSMNRYSSQIIIIIIICFSISTNNITLVNSNKLSQEFRSFQLKNVFSSSSSHTNFQIQLRRWHRDTQVYVGAFQYLANKQNRSDRRHNLGNAKSTELIQLMGFARTVLCEIETAINNTNMKMPDVYTRIEMNDTLNFRSDGRSGPDGEVDELDIKFAKVRFDELLYNLNRTLKMKRKKPMQPCKVGKHRRRHPCGGKRDVDDKRANGTTTIESTDLLVVNNGIGRRHPMRRQHQRGQRIGGGGSGGSAGAGVHPNEIFNENGNRVQRPHRRHRQHGERRLRNQLNQQSIDGGLERPHRNRRKKMHRIPTTSSTTFSPLLS